MAPADEPQPSSVMSAERREYQGNFMKETAMQVIITIAVIVVSLFAAQKLTEAAVMLLKSIAKERSQLIRALVAGAVVGGGLGALAAAQTGLNAPALALGLALAFVVGQVAAALAVGALRKEIWVANVFANMATTYAKTH